MSPTTGGVRSWKFELKLADDKSTRSPNAGLPGRFICLLLIACGECILTPVPLIYPSNDTDPEGGGGGGWRPSPGFITPRPGSVLGQTRLGYNVTVPVKRHVYDYGYDSPYDFKYPPDNGDYNGHWPPVSGPGVGPVPRPVPPPVPAPVPAPGVGYQNYPYPGPLVVRPPIQQDLLLKTLLVPLTGAALLGVAAFLVSNPVLFKLGVVAGRRRRRRNVTLRPQHPQAPAPATTFDDFLTLQKFMSQLSPEEVSRNKDIVLANYLTCSGLMADSACLEELACRAALIKPMALQDQITQIAMREILSNAFIPSATKEKVKKAHLTGLTTQSCSKFICKN